jgi:heme A synthase
MRVGRHHAGIGSLNRPALLLFVLLLLQVILGGASYVAEHTVLWPVSFDFIVWLTTAHLAVGALMLGTGVILTLSSYRLSSRSMDDRKPKKVLAEQFSV